MQKLNLSPSDAVTYFFTKTVFKAHVFQAWDVEYPPLVCCGITHTPPTIWIRTILMNEQWVEIEIEDNGIGMSSDMINKIYDPFFTTKPIGYSTGLGLAISYQIIKTHQGYIYCNSQLAKGTEFIISIPLYAFTHDETIPFPACHLNQQSLNSAFPVHHQPVVFYPSQSKIWNYS